MVVGFGNAVSDNSCFKLPVSSHRHACMERSIRKLPVNTMTQTRIFLIRHGATTLSAEDRFAGATDVPLSDEGREQAGRLAERLGGIPVAAVYASPLGRTMETARILAAPHRLEVHPRDGLREISHGH